MQVHSYDFIGDLRGRAKALETLLSDLGYSDRSGAWRHPSRHAVFLGAYADGGPEPLRALAVAVRMREAGSATMLMGLPELRLLTFATHDPDRPDRHLRPRRGERWRMHLKLLERFGGADSVAHRELATLYSSLPLWFETGNVRAVHACWDRNAATTLAPHLDVERRLTPEGLVAASLNGSHARAALDVLLGGPTTGLPDGMSSSGPDGIPSRTAHVRWWARGTSYAEVLTHPEGDPGSLAKSLDAPLPTVPGDARPTVFGRYALLGPLALTAPHAACLDHADPDLLVAYRYDGERELRASKFTKAREPRPAPAARTPVNAAAVTAAETPDRPRRRKRNARKPRGGAARQTRDGTSLSAGRTG